MAAITKPRRESVAGGRVKGSMVRAHLQFVKDRLGDAMLASTMEALPPAMVTEVQGILASSWCSFEALVALDRAIARVAGRDERELMRELGKHSAQINLSTIYRAFNRDDLHDFFRNSATLHRQFQDFGDCQYERLGDTQARITIRNAACYSPAYCASETGYLEEVIATHGGKNATVAESACQCAGDDRCTFELRWH